LAVLTVTDRPQLKIRLSDRIADAVRTSAEASGRSVTAEIERILEAHFSGQDQRAMMREVVSEALADFKAPRLTPQFDPAACYPGKIAWVLADGTTIVEKPDA
jgi:hypothetical protein